jgi:hypothetical protein
LTVINSHRRSDFANYEILPDINNPKEIILLSNYGNNWRRIGRIKERIV